jgi:hypothetical protein
MLVLFWFVLAPLKFGGPISFPFSSLFDLLGQVAKILFENLFEKRSIYSNGLEIRRNFRTMCVYKTSKDLALTCQEILTEEEGSVPLTSLY